MLTGLLTIALFSLASLASDHLAVAALALAYGCLGSILWAGGAHFLGSLVVLLYGGAVCLLFAFVIMLVTEPPIAALVGGRRA